MGHTAQPRPGNGTPAIPPTAYAARILLGLLCIPQALATSGSGGGNAGTYDTCTPVGINTVVAHVVGEFERSSSRKDYLSDWFDIPHSPGWSCIRHSQQASATLDVGLKTLMPGYFDGHFNVGGEHFSLYKSAKHKDTSIGYIMRRRLVIEPDGDGQIRTPWHPVNKTNDGHVIVPKLALPLANAQSYAVTIESQVRLVKWHNKKDPSKDFPRTNFVIEFQAAEHQYWTQHKKGHGKHSQAQGGHHPPPRAPSRFSRIRAWFNRLDRSCTTPPSRTVLLPHVSVGAFTGIGSVAGHQPFDLEFTDCAAKMHGIDYKLVPSYLETRHWPTTNANGTLILSPASTATGVRVQVLDGDGTPVIFDRTTKQPVPGYNPGDTSATLSLGARYIQTAPGVTAGTVHAMMTMLVMYK